MIFLCQFILILIAVNFTYANEFELKICTNKNDATKCLIDNFDKMYIENYKHFFEVLNESKNNALRCSSLKDAALYLNIALVIKGNAEVDEFFYSSIEKEFLINKTECLLRVLKQVKPEVKMKIISRLRLPLYLTKNEIEVALIPYANKKQYSKLIKEVIIKSDIKSK